MALFDQVNQNLEYASENEMFDTAFSWEPKRQNQFIMELNGVPSYLIKTSDKPAVANGKVTLDHINIKRQLKGKSEWNDITLTLYDPIVPSGAQAVMDWVRLHHESATGRDGYSSFYKKEVRLHQLSPLGEVVEEWILKGAFVSDAKFGTYDWGQDGVQEISVTLAYDWAFFNY